MRSQANRTRTPYLSPPPDTPKDRRRRYMHAAAKLGGWALLVALTATVTAFATPADAATGPTATLDLGTLTVDGTAALCVNLS
jgi:hypothetical protein